MIENTFIKKIAAGVLRNRKMTIAERNIMHPERDWLLGIFIGAVVVIIVAVWSFGTYEQFDNVSVVSSVESADSVIYKENLVNSALTDFGKRKEEYEQIKKNLLDKKAAATVITEPVVPEELPAEVPVEDEVVAGVVPEVSAVGGGDGEIRME